MTIKIFDYTDLNKATENLRNAQAGKENELIKQVQQSITNMKEQLRGMVMNNDITQGTKEATIEKALAETTNAQISIFEKLAGIQLTIKQAELISKELNYFTYRLETDRIKANAAMRNATASEKRADAAEITANARWLDSQANLTKVAAFAEELKERVKLYVVQMDAIEEKVLRRILAFPAMLVPRLLQVCASLKVLMQLPVKFVRNRSRVRLFWKPSAV